MDSEKNQLSDAFAQQNNARIIELLRLNPSLAGLTNRFNQDPLWLAASYGMLDVVKELFQTEYAEHIDIFRVDVGDRDAFEIAEIYYEQEVMDFLGPIYGVAGYAKEKEIEAEAAPAVERIDELFGSLRNIADRLFIKLTDPLLKYDVTGTNPNKPYPPAHPGNAKLQAEWAIYNSPEMRRKRRRRGQFVLAASATAILFFALLVLRPYFDGSNGASKDQRLIAVNDDAKPQNTRKDPEPEASPENNAPSAPESNQTQGSIDQPAADDSSSPRAISEGFLASNDDVEFQVAAASALAAITRSPPFGVRAQPSKEIPFTDSAGTQWTLRMAQEFIRDDSDTSGVEPSGTTVICDLIFTNADNEELKSEIRVERVFSGKRRYVISERIIPRALEDRRDQLKDAVINYCMQIG